MAPTKLYPDTHVQDSDCVIDSMTGLCLICGADHSEPCMDCGGRGYHKPACSQMAPPTGIAAQPFKVACEEPWRRGGTTLKLSDQAKMWE